MPVVPVCLLIALSFTLKSGLVWIINYMLLSVKGFFLERFVLLLFFKSEG